MINISLFFSISAFQFAEYFPAVYSNMQKDHFRGDFIALIYRNKSMDSDLAQAFQTAWPMSGMPKYELEEFPVPMIDVTPLWNYTNYPILSNFLRSDHARFWLQDYPAIFLSDTGILLNHHVTFLTD